MPLVGVFDSGVGGLTACHAIVARRPDLDILYLGDLARVPYGTRSPRVVTQYALSAARFFADRDIAALVVACHTASAVALDAVARALPVPVLGMIEPGARAALSVATPRTVAVLGTRTTVASGAYTRALHALDPEVEVIGRPCPLFVPLAEEGWIDGEVPQQVARHYLSDLAGGRVDTAVLGCTHYPLLAGAISAVLGPSVRIVNPAEAVAEQLDALVPAASGAGHGVLHACVTDVPDGFAKVAERFLGTAPAKVEQVDLVVGG